MRLGIIGYGNMAAAILSGALSQGVVTARQVMVFDPNEIRTAMARQLGVTVAESSVAVCQKSDVILLAVKPQTMETLLEEIGPHAGNVCFISIAAGISTGFLRRYLGSEARCIRAMPNTPMMLGCGAIAIARASGVPQELFQTVCGLFSASGSVCLIEEEQMDAIVGVNGSSPAYFFRLAAAMEVAAIEQGINAETARILIAKTMEGSAKMLRESGKTAAELTAQVTSPGGTTLAALTALDEGGFDEMVHQAMMRCTARSKELGQ